MAVRRPSSRVVLNRKALDQVTLAIAGGVEEIARTMIEESNPPDATPFGEGLVTNGGWIVYANGKKVGGGSIDGTTPQKPREFRPLKVGVSAVAGWSFPARFQEIGTVHQPARPFFMPTIVRVVNVAAAIMRDFVGRIR